MVVIMKKFLAVLLASLMMSGTIGAFADTLPEDAATAEIAETSEQQPVEKEAENIPETEQAKEYYSDAIGVEVIIQKKMSVVDSTAVFELYDAEDNFLSSAQAWIGGETQSIYLHYSVPQYKLGTDFKLKLVSGLRSAKYYSDVIEPGGMFTLHTYYIENEDGTTFDGNNFSLEGCPEYDKGICVYYNGRLVNFYARPRMIDGIAMANVEELAAAMRVKSQYYPEYNSVRTSIGSQETLFNIGTTYTTVFGNDTYISHAPVMIDDVVFIPIRDMSEAYGCTVDVLDFDDHLDIILGDAQVVTEFLNQSPVNRNGIYSRTPYLVWVDKADYAVRVYYGSQYNWELVYECPCGIGAWSTPTVEGQFEYQYRVSSWDYNSYYVGPVLVFYRGYALHSTLLNYGGGEYDGTVRAHISHGCIRMHPQDINWIADTIPVGTKIYITGE